MSSTPSLERTAGPGAGAHPAAVFRSALRLLGSRDARILGLFLGVFLLAYFLPADSARLRNGLGESVALTHDYAREHVLLCLVPAFFIAGAVAVFLSRGAVMRYLGAGAHPAVAYGTASVSGAVLAVCSCTVLPLFSGIYKRGAGLGPATAFLYSGPAINVLAVVLTARVLGLELGAARAVGAIVFSVVVGVLMALLFRGDDARARGGLAVPEDAEPHSPARTAAWFAVLVGILVFANWGRPAEPHGLWHAVYAAKWWITGGLGLLLGALLHFWFGVPRLRVAAVAAAVAALAAAVPGHPALPFAAGAAGVALLAGTAGGELRRWLTESWTFARQILPLLFAGVLAAGFLLGRPGHPAVVPESWVAGAVGGNSLGANLFASVAGAFMYFATLTEIPILQGLLGSGMGQGPALALLLAGPALSLPNMLVIRSVMGTRRTAVYVTLVVVLATATGLLYGNLFG